ncbi:MAG: carboxypeptidase regulatory-like domain-containing protein, partial [Terriglobus roseus]|nr:carboxypeptidase regulatory-like domain-containing protein [Terriglobus roseus]
MLAQTTTATLGGTVLDASGAIVPKAQVEVKNEATGDVRRSNSNGSGVFSFSALPTGDYDVTISAAGFQSYQQTKIHLNPGDLQSVRDIHLAPGDVTSTVEVTSANETLPVDSGEQSSLISAEEIKHLSVQGRDVTELLKILPGFAISRGGAGAIDNVTY